MTYDDYVSQLATLLVRPPDDPRFVEMLPWIISYAELGIYRDPDFDFLATRSAADTTSTTTPGSRGLLVPPSLVVVELVNLILPENERDTTKGTRVPLIRTTRAFIDMTWPVEADTATPTPFETYYTIRDQQTEVPVFLIAPTPDGAYLAEVYGTHRPIPLSSGNQTTFLTEFMPDLFLAKSMIVATGAILKNFGAQADDPQMALSWKAIYDDIRRGVAVESMRQKAISSGWSEFPPAPLAPLARSMLPPPTQPAPTGGG